MKDLFLGAYFDYDPFTDTVILTSNFTLHHFGLTHSALSGMKVSLEGELQTRTSTGVDSQGNFVFKILPERVYNFMNLNNVQIYFPGTVRVFTQEYRVRIILDGREIFYTLLTE